MVGAFPYVSFLRQWNVYRYLPVNRPFARFLHLFTWNCNDFCSFFSCYLCKFSRYFIYSKRFSTLNLLYGIYYFCFCYCRFLNKRRRCKYVFNCFILFLQFFCILLPSFFNVLFLCDNFSFLVLQNMYFGGLFSCDFFYCLVGKCRILIVFLYYIALVVQIGFLVPSCLLLKLRIELFM